VCVCVCVWEREREREREARQRCHIASTLASVELNNMQIPAFLESLTSCA